jgi:cysteine-rich repeat protein
MKKLFFLLALLPFAACSSTSANGTQCTNVGSTKKFNPGENVFCTCPDGTQGLKVCGESGSWEACGPCIPEEPYTEKDGGPVPVSDAPYGCGDGVNDEDEACDDGNLKDNDLCSSQCLPTGKPAAAGTCTGQPVHVWSKAVEVPYDTSGYANRERAGSTCATIDGGSPRSGSTSPERVYEVVAHRDGNLVVSTLNSTFDHILYVRRECSIASTEIQCVNRSSNSTDTNRASETLSTPVKSGDKRYVFIDGAQNSEGSGSIKFEIQPP